jgi:tetratricopeptide (TPR) repeat protein
VESRSHNPRRLPWVLEVVAAVGLSVLPGPGPHAQELGASSAQYWSLVRDYRDRRGVDALEKLTQLGEPTVRQAVSAIRTELRAGDESRWSPLNVQAAALLHLELVLRDLKDLPWGVSSHLDLSRQLVLVAKDQDRRRSAEFRRRWHLALVWRAQGLLELDEATVELRRLRDEFPRDAESVLSEGSVHETYTWPKLVESLPRPPLDEVPERIVRGHFENAESAFRRATDMDPALHEARLRLGQLLYRQRRYRDALETLKPAMDQSDDRWVTYLARLFAGACLESLEDPTAAVEHYRAALLLRPQSPTPYVALSHALRLAGNRALALTTAVGVEGGASDDPWWQYYFGQSRKLPALVEAMRREVLR